MFIYTGKNATHLQYDTILHYDTSAQKKTPDSSCLEAAEQSLRNAANGAEGGAVRK